MLTKNRSEKTEKKIYFDLKHLYHFSSDIKRNDLQFLNSKKKTLVYFISKLPNIY